MDYDGLWLNNNQFVKEKYDTQLRKRLVIHSDFFEALNAKTKQRKPGWTEVLLKHRHSLQYKLLNFFKMEYQI